MSVIYGINAVTEALKARRVSRLVHERGAGLAVDALVSRAHELRIPIDTVDRRALDKLTRGGVHQGVAADLNPLPAYTVEELVAEASGPPLLVVLDSVEDPQNVGAILRSADAAGAHGVIRQARHAAPLDGATAKGIGRCREPRTDRDRREHRAGHRRAEGAERLDHRARRRGRRRIR